MAKQKRESWESIADELERLAKEFERARGKTKLKHISVAVEREAVRAGYNALEVVKGGAIPYLAEAAKALPNAADFWKLAAVPWLAKTFPGKVNVDSAAWDSQQAARDDAGNVLGKDGKALALLDEKGKAMPAVIRPGRKPKSWRLRSELAFASEAYDEGDWQEHLCVCATNYANACRVLAGLLREKCASTSAKKMKRRRRPAKDKADGPQEPKAIPADVLSGLPSQHRRIMEAMWERDELSVEAFVNAVWGKGKEGEHVKDNQGTLRTAVRRFNEALRKKRGAGVAGLDWTLSTEQAERVVKRHIGG